MEKFTELMEKYIGPFANKMARNKYVIALRDGISAVLPMLIFGSIGMLIPNLPFLEYVFPAESIAVFKSYITQSYNIAMNLTAMIISFTIAYQLAKRLRDEEVDPLRAGLAGLFSFLMIIPLRDNLDLPLDNLGSMGMFVGILCGIGAGELYGRFVKKGWTIKLPDSVPEAVSQSFASLIPMVLIFLIATAIRIVFKFTPYGNIMDCVFSLLQKPLMNVGGTIYSCILVNLFGQLCWFFGIHPGGITGAVYSPILMALSQENFSLIAQGLKPVNIINAQFVTTWLDTIPFPIAMAICLIFFCKRQDMRDIGKLGVPAGCFNIGEPIGFGLPTVLNPYLIIPSMCSYIISLGIGYIATVTQIVPIAVNTVPWTCPTFISGILATGSITTGFVQLLALALVTLTYLPFMKMFERAKNREDAEYEKKLREEADA